MLPNIHTESEMKHINQHFLYFSRSQQAGILALTLLLATALWVPGIYRTYQNQKVADEQPDSLSAIQQQEILDFLTHLQARTSQQKNSKWQETADRLTHQIPAIKPFAFNPNDADSVTLCRLGLPGWMAHNILRYRDKGGRFRKPADFQKIYGLDKTTFETLLPYIVIPPEADKHTPSLLLVNASDSLHPKPPEKFAPGTLVELNSADTTILKKIPGIGSAIARSIVNYRQQLGGFYAIEQLQDIRLDYNQLRSWFSIDESCIRRIPVNKASVERLQRHPYINFYQAKALVEHRRKKGRLLNLKPFVLLEEFSPQDLERIQHYLSF
ncbi:hypothetical protein EVA_13964 [gut metagenome]|uniref:Helix-hairpin-helix domain-containing protein n=1 Tax=gut metagenome TaxID=749906 RepID=J9CD81_9ZZZZ